MILTIVTIIIGTVSSNQIDPALDQLVLFKERHPNPIGTFTTSSGAAVSFTEANSTLNTKLLVNEYFLDSSAHFVREKIPERIVHAKAAGAIGYFEVTHDISHICRAKLFSEVGKRTKVAARFSTAFQEVGGSDLSRDLRGFSIRFYTEDGIFDIVCGNLPVFVIKDPVFFTLFIHSLSNNPATSLKDPNMMWDFITQRNETFYLALMMFSDPGIPKSYRNMPGFGIHTYQVKNNHRDMYFIRFHFIPNSGIKNLSTDDARAIQSVDPDYFTSDLYRAIGNEDFPSWNLSIQVLSLEEVKKAGSYVFDVTRTLPLDKYPLTPVGKLVLNQNTVNHFLEVEQIAFSPANLVQGIDGAPDRLFEARRLAYREAHSYRLGSNYDKISVNCPFHSLTYNRDGTPPVGINGYDIPNYYPNSFNGPVPYASNNRNTLIDLIEGEPNNLQEVSDYVKKLSEEEFNRLIENILYSLRPVVKFIRDRAVKQLTTIYPELGNRIAQGLLI